MGFYVPLPVTLPRWHMIIAVVFVMTATEAIAGPIVSVCPAPLAPRRALPSDTVCVDLASRKRIAAENARAPLLWVPGPFGPKTCANGYVWREAMVQDLVCVTPDIRSFVASEQANPMLAVGQ